MLTVGLKVLGALILGVAAFSTVRAFISLAPWFPTRYRDFERIFKLAKLKEGENFIDLGCGTGGLVLAAARRGAYGIGIELSLPLFLIAWLRGKYQPRTKFYWRNIFNHPLTNIDIVYLFGNKHTLTSRLTNKLKQELKTGARVVSYAFPLAGLAPSRIDKPSDQELPIYLYQF
ncbi:hypothetical protein D6821_01685 [Candidatus Parcubacteria bacterium]|nr:MAG: hypothetical protein D6821_01685 [Candidatus Parcubacteria bacterium]